LLLKQELVSKSSSGQARTLDDDDKKMLLVQIAELQASVTQLKFQLLSQFGGQNTPNESCLIYLLGQQKLVKCTQVMSAALGCEQHINTFVPVCLISAELATGFYHFSTH
jgi:hypothetical protein